MLFYYPLIHFRADWGISLSRLARGNGFAQVVSMLESMPNVLSCWSDDDTGELMVSATLFMHGAAHGRRRVLRAAQAA